MCSGLATLAILALAGVSPAAAQVAQQVAQPEAQPAEGAQQTQDAAPAGDAEVPAEGDATAPAATAPEVTGTTAAPPPPPPVVVITVARDRVQPPVAAAIRDAVVAQLRPHVERRELISIGDEETLNAAAACTTAECLGAIVAQRGGIVGVLVQAQRARLRDPVIVMIGLIDPVSGAAQGEPVQGEIPRDQIDAPAEALAPITAQLAGRMPPAPRSTTLLIAANVDGATVTLNGREIGQTPLPPGNVPPGEYTVGISRPGFAATSREVNVAAGQAARVDFDLEATGEQIEQDALLLHHGDAEAAAAAAAAANDDANASLLSRWWFWAAVGGGAVVLGVLIGVIAAVASSGEDPQQAVAVPPIIPVMP